MTPSSGSSGSTGRGRAAATGRATVAQPRGGAPAQERELRAQGKKTMRKLLDAAMIVFERRGYHAARVDDIVKVAKTSHGTFYLYFANKEDLFRTLTADVAEEMTALSESLAPIRPTDDGYRDLREWLGRFASIYEHYGAVIRAWTEAETDGTEFGRIGTDVLASFTRTLIDRVRESKGATGVDPQLAALVMVAMIERSNYYMLSRRLDIDRDEMLDTAATMLHVGLFAGTRKARKRTPAARR
jgi:AcrR family transcriptional regulator